MLSIKKKVLKGLAIFLVFALVFGGINYNASTGEITFENNTVSAAPTVSYIDISGDKMTFMVDGQPFFYSGIDYSPHRLMYDYGWTWADMAQIYQRAANDGFTVMATPIMWYWVEPSKNTFDWSTVDTSIEYARANNLKLEFNWFGSDVCQSYMSVPDYVTTDYAYVLKSDGTKATDGLGNYKLCKADTNLLTREKYVLSTLMEHIASYISSHGYGHILVGVEVLNEPSTVTFENGEKPTDRSYSTYANSKWTSEGWSDATAFDDEVLWNYLNELAKIVKDSNYPVWTRVNFPDNSAAKRIPAKNEAKRASTGTYLDFVGTDIYSDGLSAVYDYCTGPDVNTGKNVVMVMENSGAYTNTDKLMFNAWAGDGNYHICELNQTMPTWDLGLYTTNADKTISARSHTQSVRDMIAMVNKDKYDLARLKAGGVFLKFYNKEFASSVNQIQAVGGMNINYNTTAGGGGIVAARDSNNYVFLSSKQSTYSFPSCINVVSLQKGYFDGNNNWVSQGDVAYTDNGAKKTFTINAYECIRLTAASVPVSTVYECENLMTACSSGDTQQDYTDYNNLSANAVNDYVEYTVNVTQTGSYTVYVNDRIANNRGNYQLSINGTNIGAVIDEYSYTSGFRESKIGSFNFSTTGNKLFRFKVTGKNADSSGYQLGYDYIRLMPSETVFENLTTTFSLEAIEDTYVDTQNPGTSFGTAGALQVRYADNVSPIQEMRSFFKFDIRSIPTDVEIVSAKLNIHGGVASTSRVLSVFSVSDDTWTEGNSATTGINWDTQPSYNLTELSHITLTKTTDTTTRIWQTDSATATLGALLDVTSFLQQQKAENDNTISLMLKFKARVSSSFYIDSSEAASNIRPFLSIVTQPKDPYKVSRTVFSNAGGTMQQLPKAPGLVNCAVQITNNRDSVLNAVLIAAAYKDNVLYNIVYKPVSVTPTGSSQDFDVELNVPDDTYIVKTFLWNSMQGMKPLSTAVSIDRTQILPTIP